MTMPNTSHPDDERLAACAGGDADAASDRALAEHVSACDRCAPIVDELTLLRVALATLPDLAPSRPLRLIPPVPSSAPRPIGPLGWLRRLAAPAMAAGAGLVVVGAVGMSGVASSFSGAAGADRAALEAASSSGAAAPGESVVPAPGQGPETHGLFSPVMTLDDGGRSETPAEYGSPDSQSASASPRASASPGEDDLTGFMSSPADEQPWLTLLIAGAAIFGVSTVLRFSLATQAG
ncbi:MAG: hypothetical protein WD116_03370 [Chloroflexota bacterium]